MVPIFDLTTQCKEWSSPPVGGKNVSNLIFDDMTNLQVREWAQQTYAAHYSPEANPACAEGKYRELLGLNTTQGHRVLDFGCGFSMDGLSYAANGNTVSLADIVPGNIRAAARLFLALELLPAELIIIGDRWPFFTTSQPFDIFHSSGVLHHTPMIREILQRASVLLSENGEIRLMLYTEHLWTIATELPPPDIKTRVWTHEAWPRFVKYADAVGGYADWYSADKLQYYTDDFLKLQSWEYMRPDKGYAVAILSKKRR